MIDIRHGSYDVCVAAGALTPQFGERRYPSNFQLPGAWFFVVASLCLLPTQGAAQTPRTIATALTSGDYAATQGLSYVPGKMAISENSSDHWIKNTLTGEAHRLFVVHATSGATANFGAIDLGGVGIFAQGTKPPEIQYLGWPYEWNSGAHITSYTTGAWTDWWTATTPSGLEAGNVQVRVSGMLRFTNTGVNWNSNYENAGKLFAVSLNGSEATLSIEDNGNYNTQYVKWETVLSLPLNQAVEINGTAFLRSETRDQSWWDGSKIKRELIGHLQFYTSNISVLGPAVIETSDYFASFDSELPRSSYSLFASSGALDLGESGYNYKAANELISSIHEPQSAWMLMAGLLFFGALTARAPAATHLT